MCKHRLEVICGPMFCHAKGQKLLLSSGLLMPVESLKIGDRLLGPDGRARNVLATHQGIGQMARIIPGRGGRPFVVTLDHQLTLMDTCSKRNGKPSEKGGRVVDVSVRNWLSWSKTRKNLFKLFRVGVLSFESDGINHETDIEPYFLGVLLGDGSITQGVGVTTTDKEIVNEVFVQCSKWGLRPTCDDITWRLSGTPGVKNVLIEKLRALRLYGCTSGDKFIPSMYKTASFNDRAALLAGLIDTDGSNEKNLAFSYSTKSKLLAEDVAFLARSLGLSVTITPTIKKCQTGATGDYQVLHIGGEVGLVPTRLPRKQIKNRVVKHRSLLSRFDVELVHEPQEYFGVTVDGDHRYLMDDFTVTHNSGKTEELIRRVNRGVYAKQSIMVFKPIVDIRYLGSTIKSHAKRDLEEITGIKPILISSAAQAISFYGPKTLMADIVAFDEAQFYEPSDILSTVTTLLGYTRVICAGLDLDRDGRSFGGMPDLLALADHVTKVKSICTNCGRDASRTFWLGEPYEGGQVVVGGEESYTAKCLPCWHISRETKREKNDL